MNLFSSNKLFYFIFLLNTTLLLGQEQNQSLPALNELIKSNSLHVNCIQRAISSLLSNKLQFEQLWGGISEAKVYCFQYEGKKYVLKLLDPNEDLEIRKSEVNGHKLASSLGIAPKVFYADENSLIILMEFIDGRRFSRSDFQNKSIISKLMKNIKKFHEYTGSIDLRKKKKFNQVVEDAFKYENEGTVYPSCETVYYKDLLRDYANLQEDKVTPCHGDWFFGNIFITKDEEVYFIDFADARFDNPFLDIGTLAFLSGADANEVNLLLEEYLSRKPSASELKQVAFFQELTAFRLGIEFLSEQEEKNQKKLDDLLNEPLKSTATYAKEGVTLLDNAQKRGKDATIFALGFFQDFVKMRQDYLNIK